MIESPKQFLGYDTPFHEPIGKYVFQFGYLERDLDWCVSALLGIEYYGQGELVFSQVQSVPARISLIAALAAKKTKVTELLEELDGYLGIIREQNRFRNALVHGSWGSFHYEPGDEKRGSWQKIYINRNSLKPSVFHVTIEEIQQNYESITIHGSRIQNLVQTILSTPDYPFGHIPSPGKRS